jgi:hypothetical protein
MLTGAVAACCAKTVPGIIVVISSKTNNAALPKTHLFFDGFMPRAYGVNPRKSASGFIASHKQHPPLRQNIILNIFWLRDSMPQEFTANKILQQMESVYDERPEIPFARK